MLIANEKEKSQYLLKIESLTKKIEEANNKRKSMEKSIKDQAIDANKIIEKIKKGKKDKKEEKAEEKKKNYLF